MIFFGSILLVLASCMGNAEEKKQSDQGSAYDFSSPKKTYTLPKILKEVSGIDLMPNNKIACIQDETGTVFIYNLNTEKIEQEIPFAGKGDYEDISVSGNDFYILRSDGTIFHKTSSETQTYEMPQLKNHDTESLCLDKENHALVVGGKKTPKSFYALDLKSLSVKEPALFSLNEKGFSPTAIEIHPVTKQYYILSKTQLIVVSKEGVVQQRYNLSPSLFPQPEGICFKEDGTLYISNEGVKSKATILEFNYHSL